ncbi:Os01g0151750, partial [Oryza sativa Japonica Group]
AFGFSSMIFFLTTDAASVFLAAMMTWAPLIAKTREVSRPMPLAPPVRQQNLQISVNLRG